MGWCLGLPVCAGVDRHHGGGWTGQRGVPPTRIVCGVAHQRPDVQGVVWLLGRNVDPLTQWMSPGMRTRRTFHLTNRKDESPQSR